MTERFSGRTWCDTACIICIELVTLLLPLSTCLHFEPQIFVAPGWDGREIGPPKEAPWETLGWCTITSSCFSLKQNGGKTPQAIRLEEDDYSYHRMLRFGMEKKPSRRHKVIVLGSVFFGSDSVSHTLNVWRWDVGPVSEIAWHNNNFSCQYQC